MVGRVVPSCVLNHKTETDPTERNGLVADEMDRLEDDEPVEYSEGEESGTGK